MIARVLFSALENGLRKMKEDPKLVQYLFRDDYELNEVEVDAITALFDRRPPTVIHGFPRTDTKLPVFSIVLGLESGADRWLHDDTATIDEAGVADSGADLLSSAWQHRYNILTCSDHPDVTAYYYEMAKSILIASHAALAHYDLYDIDISGGDLAPDGRYLPEHVFVRQLSFRCKREYRRIPHKSRFGRAFRVAGIPVDSSGSPSDPGNIWTNATVTDGHDG